MYPSVYTKKSDSCLAWALTSLAACPMWVLSLFHLCFFSDCVHDLWRVLGTTSTEHLCMGWRLSSFFLLSVLGDTKWQFKCLCFQSLLFLLYKHFWTAPSNFSRSSFVFHYARDCAWASWDLLEKATLISIVCWDNMGRQSMSKSMCISNWLYGLFISGSNCGRSFKIFQLG